MSTAKNAASEFIKSYGTRDNRAVNDCYSVFTGEGVNFLNLFMHNNAGIKSAFSINDLGRNEDVKIHEAEVVDSCHDYHYFEKFGLDITFCEHEMNLIVRKPGVKNTGCKFTMHNQIFNPNSNILNMTPGTISEDAFYDRSKIASSGLLPSGWCLDECYKNNFYIATNGDLTLDYGFSVMGKTTSYWRESMSREKILSVKQKCFFDNTVPTNRLLSTSIVKGIQIGSELASDTTVILSCKQNLNIDLKSQYRISFHGIQEEGAFARTFCVPFENKSRMISFYAKTVADNSNERTTLIIKVVTKTVDSHLVIPIRNHVNCEMKIGARVGLVDFCDSDPNYNQLIVKNLLSVHTQFTINLSEVIQKPVIVFKMYDKELHNDYTEVSGRILNYQVDSEGNIYFLSKTLEVLPKSLSTLSYLGSIAPIQWKECLEHQHFVVKAE
ncbi:NSs [Orthotospovirus citrullomaculosi]|uniref:NSs n=1 Tax=Watermelon silver mottle virus TaxID=3052571 RepID=P89253_WASMV|nr:NSs [Orthotospovirus citrullomaculosi]AAB36955.1 NSs [Orthotospovirus citrullomaculosi]